MSDREIDVWDLIGGEFDFYGVDGQRFNLDGLVYEVVEDDDSFDEIRICDDRQGFHGLPIARVAVEEDDIGIYALNDLHDDHCWLKFGTEYRCDERGRVVGQSFVFEYTPKESGD